ncbi:MAG: BREX system ATP-binding domain-containing protein [Candidatus Tectomicrobia bacterium]
MTIVRPLEDLKSVEARAIIENLRRGSVPVEHVPYFTVGRERWLSIIEDDLTHYIAAGGTKVRFLNGDYGDGKTHFLSVIQHLVQRQDFAVSFVVLTREVPMHKFELVYRELAAQLATAQGVLGLRGLITQWLETLQAQLGDQDQAVRTAHLNEIAETLKGLEGMDLNFAHALIGLIHHRFAPLAEGETPEQREDEQQILYQWFEGGRLSKRELRPLQIFESLNKGNSKRLLLSLIAFLRHLGYQGLILLLDELETVMAQSASMRNAAYENVRLFIDNAEQAHHLHVFFSIIPDVILAEKGFRSYDALWSRVRSVGESRRLNYRSVVIDLHRTPLATAELLELGQRLRHIHELAYRWEATSIVDDAFIQQVCETQQRMGLLSEVRLFIKQLIRYLDTAEQDGTLEDVDVADQVAAVQQEIAEEKDPSLRPAWDA